MPPTCPLRGNQITTLLAKFGSPDRCVPSSSKADVPNVGVESCPYLHVYARIWGMPDLVEGHVSDLLLFPSCELRYGAVSLWERVRTLLPSPLPHVSQDMGEPCPSGCETENSFLRAHPKITLLTLTLSVEVEQVCLLAYHRLCPNVGGWGWEIPIDINGTVQTSPELLLQTVLISMGCCSSVENISLIQMVVVAKVSTQK